MSAVLTRAVSALGSPYRWGAQGPSRFDCSGLVQWAYRYVGPDLSALALYDISYPVGRGDEEPGDLAFPLDSSGRPLRHVALFEALDRDTGRVIVIEAGGGDSTTVDDNRAILQNASVRHNSWARDRCEVRRWNL